jgi:ABC-type lipoprotein release transport system permease subunit
MVKLLRTSRLVWQETARSPGTTTAVFLSIALSVATATAVHSLSAALRERVRKIMVEMGNNLFILPPGARMEEIDSHSSSRPTMDEGLVEEIATDAYDALGIRHIVPELRGSLPYGGRTLRVLGRGGERDMGSTVPPSVAPGEVVPGSEAAAALRLSPGRRLTLGGRSFLVKSIAPPSGTPDDAAITMALFDAQDLLGTGRRITAISALACFCAGPYLTSAQEKVRARLPQNVVVTVRAIALARLEARNSVERIGWRITAAIVALAALVVLLSLLGNVSRRRGEIGTLLAIGARPGKILALLGWKVAALAVAGGAGGWAAGTVAVRSLAPALSIPLPPFDLALLGLGVGLALATAAVGALLPAMHVLRLDPAEVIREG